MLYYVDQFVSMYYLLIYSKKKSNLFKNVKKKPCPQRGNGGGGRCHGYGHRPEKPSGGADHQEGSGARQGTHGGGGARVHREALFSPLLINENSIVKN